ncbi:winged helix-turn-helix domain-containing protein [Shewanella woodyi]|uniref:Transcriptional regulator, CadC n=1 Tax=Shewanella woodyi (strain ATCC 51908 / MS32) TaxID=392500 RepID=B1KN36_SHEWM|nr:winged helix-turn-helix domain-containing protein [Shewanella woodyi]ACA88993.1 transcriptional regulator, CadC [Shewanella woodyi ATCC 51908]
MIYTFGHCHLNTKTHQLYVNDGLISLENRQFLLLQLLAKSGNQVVSRDHLLENLWPKQIVSDTSLSRLISDTRKLIGDDGKSQHIIKTCRGGGFMLVPPITMSDTEQPTLTSRRGIAVSVSLLGLLLLALTYLGYNAIPQKSDNYQLIITIQQQLDITKTAFIAQTKRRNELGKTLGIEAGGDILWEQVFSAAYPDLTKRQKFIFDQIRGITQGAMYNGNQAIADILQQNPDLKNQIASLGPLLSHLNYWLAKYQQVFLQREDMCLLYVGREDGVPFPSRVDKDVADWLAANKS